MGSKNPDSVYNPNQAIKDKNFNSVNSMKSTSKNQTKSKITPIEKKIEPPKTAVTNSNNVPKKVDNPFLVSNPFYLDE